VTRFSDRPARLVSLEERLLRLAVLFVLLYAIILTLAPAVRLHTFVTPLRWTHWIGVAIWATGFIMLRRFLARHYPDHDAYLLPVTALLSGWGLMTIWRLDSYYGLRQTIWLAISLLAMAGAARIPGLLKQIKRYKYLWLAGGLALTALTFVMGTFPGGAGPRLWLGCCGVYLQPSEPLKLLLVIYLAAYLADRLPLGFKLLHLLTPTLVLLGVALALLVFQRDLGTASLIIMIYLAVVYLATGRKRVLLSALLITIAGIVVAFFTFAVIRVRITAWLNPWLDPGGASYQIVQSLIALAEGGLFGAGPGLGSPAVVPVAQSDFVFTAMIEEMGLVGAFSLLLLVGLLFIRGMRTALFAPNAYQRFLAAGATLFLTIQSILIIGGNIRLLPLTGVTLPFISYGGSSLLTSMLAMLLIIAVSASPGDDPAVLPRPSAYLVLTGAGLAALVGLACLSIWWGVLRAATLQARTDNPRRVINDRFVTRGRLLDRANQVLSETVGSAGEFRRVSRYPALSTTLGYNDPLYGQGGLEAALDPYLRGVQGYPASTIWSTDLLYNQPPPGLDVRLSIDRELQATADQLLANAGAPGAIILINAKTGELLALSSYPFFDPDSLSTNWDALKEDATAPLLNRATQGLYPLGSAITPLALTVLLENQDLPALPDELGISTDTVTLRCRQNPGVSPDWQSALGNGCPAASVRVLNTLIPSQVQQLLARTGLDKVPEFLLEMSEPVIPNPLPGAVDFIAGKNPVMVTPLQVAQAAATITYQGQRPTARIAMAVQTPHQGWVILPTSGSTPSLPENGSLETISLLTSKSSPVWSYTALAPAQFSQTPVKFTTWHMTGTLSDWQGVPLAAVVVLEGNLTSTAAQIGAELMKAAQTPTSAK